MESGGGVGAEGEVGDFGVVEVDVISDEREGVVGADGGWGAGFEAEDVGFFPNGFAGPSGFDFQPWGGGYFADAVVGAGGFVEDEFDLAAWGDAAVGDVQAGVGQGGGDEDEEEEEEEEMFHGGERFQKVIATLRAKDVFETSCF